MALTKVTSGGISDIAAAVEGASDSNKFTDADHSKLNAIEASADVTDATNVTAAGALMDSEVTNLSEVKAFSASDYATSAQGTLATNALPKAGGTMTGDLILGDNVKSLYGTGSDLEIYHNGSHSRISDVGTGKVQIGSATQVEILNGNFSEPLAQFVPDGAVTLYHNNSAKIATSATGATVTGTLAATAVTGDGSGLTGVDPFPSGTVIPFFQASAPTGWTQVTSQNNKVLRVVSGTGGGTGGTWATSSGVTTSSHGGHSHTSAAHSHTGAAHTHTSAAHTHTSAAHTHTSAAHTHSTSAHTLSTAQMPAHSHGKSPYAPGASAAYVAAGYNSFFNSTSNETLSTGGGGSHTHGNTGSTTPGATGNTTPGATGSTTPGSGGTTTPANTGSAGSHTHTISAPQYIDVIICSKD